MNSQIDELLVVNSAFTAKKKKSATLTRQLLHEKLNARVLAT